MTGRKTDETAREELSREQPAPLKGNGIQAVGLDLRSNGENDWQDERPEGDPAPKHTKTSRSRTSEQLEKSGEGSGGSFGDADSARSGGAAPKESGR